MSLSIQQSVPKGLLWKTILCALPFCPLTSFAQASGTYAPDGYSIQTIKAPEGVAFEVAGLAACENDTVYAAIRIGDVWALDNSAPEAALTDPK